ncbi:ATP-grasp domain-containing protein [Methylomonas sp. HYX-M1]|uniref:ATP-grasp domain-containing protein n=1 Tax=Methylomonas sp. HYX-M1 TaxID=3139307 RepID=UPI00345B894F
MVEFTEKKILIVARSGRMLAALARQAGLLPLLVDCFADMDSRALAADWRLIESLHVEEVRKAVTQLRHSHRLDWVVYGSGLERFPDTVEYLQRQGRLLGNGSEVVRALQHKPTWFCRLTVLGIAFPETQFVPPQHGKQWLLKPWAGEGGTDIRHYVGGDAVDSSRYYWQRFQTGVSMSALFVAGNGGVKILGFNRQWCLEESFMFRAIRNGVEVSVAVNRTVTDWLQKLAAALPLCGLGSLDFLCEGDDCYFLEINPRIPASAQLYGEQAFSAHCSACDGKVTGIVMERRPPMVYQIVFAAKSVRIPENMDWPDCVSDRPAAGSIIGKGQPICSIIAAADDAGQLVEGLTARTQFILKLINQGSNSHAISG